MDNEIVEFKNKSAEVTHYNRIEAPKTKNTMECAEDHTLREKKQDKVLCVINEI